MRLGSAKHGRVGVESGLFLLQTQTLYNSLQPLDQNQCLVPHLKNLHYICFEPEAQGHGMTFKEYKV